MLKTIRYILGLGLMLSTLSAQALSTGYYSTSSRLASGKWVKISAPEEGIYQLSYQTLQAMGFSNPAAVQVWGYSATALPGIRNAFSEDFPDDLLPTATQHTGQKLLFYSQGEVQTATTRAADTENSVKITRNFHDRSSYFFLSETGATPVAQRPSAEASRAVVSSHIHVDLFEDDVQNPAEGGCDFHGAEVRAGAAIPYTLKIKNYHPSNQAKHASFNYSVAVRWRKSARMSVATPDNVTVDASTDNLGSYVPEQSYDAYRYATGYRFFSPAGDGEYTFTVNVPQVELEYCAPQRAFARYPRLNSLDSEDPFLVMNLHDYENLAGQPLLFPGSSADKLAVWNLDKLTDITAYPVTTVEGGTGIVLDAKATRIVAFDPTMNFPEPTVVESLENQNLHGASTPDMLIITTAEIAPYATQLAQMHKQYQGLDVLVVDHKAVYNEFSSGARDPMAYRRLAKMFYDRDPRKFKYLMFFGPVHYDSRNINIPAGSAVPDRMVCYEQDNQQLWMSTLLNYSADAYFGMLDDAYRHDNIQFEYTRISVGRVPAMNGGQAAAYVDKCRRLLEAPPSPETFSRMMVITGPGDDGDHTRHGVEVAGFVREARPEMNVVHICNETYPDADAAKELMPKAIHRSFQAGTGYLSYSGHGSPVAINGWDITHANSDTYDHPAFVMFSSCDQFAFDRQHNGLTEVMMFTPTGGAIGGFGACRSVYISSNQVACVPMAKTYAEAKAGDTFGQLHMRMRSTVLDAYHNGSYDYRMPQQSFRNLLAYNLAGDPAMPVGAPALKARLTAVGSTELSAEATGEAPSLRTTSFAGEITLADGQPDSGFKGEVTVVVFDGARVQKSVSHSKESGYVSQDITLASDELARATGTVSGGKFTVDLLLPIPTYQAASYRVGIYARGTDGTGALGTYEDLSIVDGEDDPAEQTAPEIVDFSLESFDLKPGETFGSAILTATIDPSPSGLTFKTGDVASHSRLILDLTSEIAIEQGMSKNADGSYTLRVAVPKLTQGDHTAELLLVSNVGLSARRSISFNLTPDDFHTSLSVGESPAREQATFQLSTNGQAQRLYIADSEGRTVYSVENPVFPLQWNLEGSDGQPVADGHYRATVLTSTPAERAHSSIEFVILRK